MSEKDHFEQLAIWLEMESVAERQRLADVASASRRGTRRRVAKRFWTL